MSKGVPFFDVCRAIGSRVTAESWPILVSLECHIEVEGQKELVKQMLEAWGEKLVKGKIHNSQGHLTPVDVKGKILLMVCYVLFYRGFCLILL